MLGVRFTPFLVKSCTQSMARLSYIPKCHFSLLNLETTSLLNRTSLLPSNLLIKNIIQMLEKIKDETEKAQEIDITTLSLLKSVLKISHIKDRTINDLPLLEC